MTTVDPAPHDLAVVAALATIPGSHPVGFAKAPAGALNGVLRGTGPDYLVVWPISGLLDGSLEDPWRDADLVYQITCHGHLPEGARWLVGQLEPALRTVVIPGRSLVNVIPDDVGPVRLDTDVKPELNGAGVYIATPRYRLVTVPT